MFLPDDLKHLRLPHFYHGQKSHYGVALLTKAEPVAVRKGFAGDDEDAQRRLDYGGY